MSTLDVFACGQVSSPRLYRLTDLNKKIKFSEWSTLLCKRQDLIEPLDAMFSEEQNSKCDQEERAYSIVDNKFIEQNLNEFQTQNYNKKKYYISFQISISKYLEPVTR